MKNIIKIYSLLFILCLFTTLACKQNKSGSTAQNGTSTPLPKQVEPTDSLPAPTVDSTFVTIKQIISEELKARNLKFSFAETDDSNDTLKQYRYTFEGTNYTAFLLNIRTFASEQLAKQEMTDIQTEKTRMIANNELTLIAWHYFRLNNKLYSMFCTADIDHIRGKAYRRILKQWNINDTDIEAL